MKKYLLYLLIIISSLFLSQNVFSQTATNLDLFLNLADSSVKDILAQVPDSVKYLKIDMNFSDDYSVFKNRLITDFYKANKNIVSDQLTSKGFLTVSYTLEDATVKYGDVFRDGLLGDFFTVRDIDLKGNYIIEGGIKAAKDFNYLYKDSVKVNDIKNLENNAYGFTQSEIPSEPFFSNLYEPLIAIGAAAVAVFLFFAIRSK